MGDARITSPLVTVIRDGFDPLTVQTDNRDLVLWDRTRVKHKWPVFQDAPNIWLTFISWAAARRIGAIPGDLRYEDWEATVLEIGAETDDEDDSDLGNPFREVPGPD